MEENSFYEHDLAPEANDQQIKKIPPKHIVIIAALALLALCCAFIALTARPKVVAGDVASIINKDVHLRAAECEITTICEGEFEGNIGSMLPVTTRLKASVNLSAVDPRDITMDDENNYIYMKLQDPVVEVVSSINEYNQALHFEGRFNKLSDKGIESLAAKANQEIREAIENGGFPDLVNSAKQQAGFTLNAVARRLGYQACIITWQDSKIKEKGE